MVPPEFLSYICPYCASFDLNNSRGFKCNNCGSNLNTRHLKLVHNYSEYVYLYGHRYREDYQNQVDKNGEITVFHFLEPDSVYKFIGLAILSGVLGNLAWVLVIGAVQKIISEFNIKFGQNHKISELELHNIYKSFEIFIKHSDKIDKKVMDGIMEEILAHESDNKLVKKIAENSIEEMITKNPKEKEKLRGINIKLIKEISKALPKKIKKLKEAEEENYSDYWGKIKIEKCKRQIKRFFSAVAESGMLSA